ncbi:MAG: recombination mediator RecR [Planctomycetota bacterium]|nr:recombination mediator RecR [Planctomycetota bacterium]
MEFKSPALDKLVEELQKLPGIGSKTAERLAHHILRLSREDALQMAEAIEAVKETVTYCKRCYNFAEGKLCSICDDSGRDTGKICVVEQARDLAAIEKSGSYDGTYHVLLGALAPLDGIEPENLTFDSLLKRVKAEDVAEVIIATNPSFEGEGTALYLHEMLSGLEGLRLTRIARGMPSGSQFEHVGRNIVSDAFEGRREMS